MDKLWESKAKLPYCARSCSLFRSFWTTSITSSNKYLLNLEVLDFFAQRSAGFLHGAGLRGTRHLLSELQLQGQESVLEIGVGTGATLVALKSIWPQLDLQGLDVSPAMLQSAQRRLRFCGWSQIPLRQVEPQAPYPFPDNSFDVVLVESVLAIQSLDNLQQMLTEIHRILRPGGRLACNETLWLPGQSPAELQAFNERCREHFGIIQSLAELPDVEAWKGVLNGEGWNLEYCERVEAREGTITFGWRNRLSQFYSKWSDWRARRDPQHAHQAKWLQEIEKELLPPGQQRLNAYLMISRKV